MVRMMAAGLIGGLVLFLWSVVFSVVGPEDDARPLSEGSAATVELLRTRVASIELPFGPSAANAGPAANPAPRSGAAPEPRGAIDYTSIGQSLMAACGAAGVAALLMTWFGGAKRPFAERVLFSVLLGCFAALATSVPAGAWTEFSLHRTTMLLGETVVGWLLAGMVMAVLLNPKPRRARA
ncbi:MAG: hypothetical protein IPJ41_02590 [Phycisphaerales bacterium]|nr:hypothetical protein [Phycisphaerales bacterium]